MITKFEIFSKKWLILVVLGVIFGHSGGRKSRFFDFLKFEIFSKKWLILVVFRGHFWPFWRSKKSFFQLFQICFGVD